MIDLNKPMIERDSLELIELEYYLLRTENDSIVKAMEQLQAAGAGCVELQEVRASESPDEGTVEGVHLTAASISSSVMSAYRELEAILNTHRDRIKAFRSYLELNDVEVAESMKELLEAQN